MGYIEIKLDPWLLPVEEEVLLLLCNTNTSTYSKIKWWNYYHSVFSLGWTYFSYQSRPKPPLASQSCYYVSASGFASVTTCAYAIIFVQQNLLFLLN